MLTQEQMKTLTDEVGVQASAAMKKELDNYEAKVKTIADEAAKNHGGISKQAFDEYKTATDTALTTIKDIAVKQGNDLAAINVKVNGSEVGEKSMSAVLTEAEPELKKIYSSGVGRKSFML